MSNAPEQIDKRGNFISTLSGAKFFVDECNIGEIPIEDVAHALGMNCRYNGHVTKHYSVAEHSVLVSLLVPKEDAFWGLMHDVTEAFVPDVPRPFKHLIHGFQDFESTLAGKMAEYYKLDPEEPDTVKFIDKHIVGSEAAVLFPNPPDWVQFYDDVCPSYLIKGLSPKKAKAKFLERFEELC
jgi:hypothetical protein